MTDFFKGGFTDPYASDELEIDRRRQLAAALQKQSLEPLHTETAGGWAIPISPWQGVAKMVQGGMSGYNASQAQELARALRDKTQADAMKWYSQQPQNRILPGASDQESAGGGAPIPAQFSQPSKQDQMQWMMQGQLNPLTAPISKMMMAQALKPPEVGKVDADKFTPASVAKFAQTGNYSDLVPRDKYERVPGVGPTGQPVSQWVNPYAPPQSGVPHPMPGFLGQLQALGILQPGMEKDPRVQQILSGYLGKETGQITPAMAEELKIKLGHLANEGARVGLERQKTWWETRGTEMGGGASMPRPPQPFNLFGNAPTQNPGAPYNAPIQPRAASATQPIPVPSPQPRPQPSPSPVPSAMGGGVVTPKAQAEIAAELYKQKVGAQQILNTLRFDPKTGEDDVSKLIKASTSGVVENVAAHAWGALPGTTATTGRQAIGQLEALSAKLTMDLMGGKLGSGISNADRDFVVTQLGKMGDAHVNSAERLAAWNNVLNRLRVTATGRQPLPPANVTGTIGTPQRRSSDWKDL